MTVRALGKFTIDSPQNPCGILLNGNRKAWFSFASRRLMTIVKGCISLLLYGKGKASFSLSSRIDDMITIIDPGAISRRGLHRSLAKI